MVVGSSLQLLNPSGDLHHANWKSQMVKKGKGFGFIKPSDGGDDLFVHYSQLNGSTLKVGELVEFELGEGHKGPCAINVKKIN